MLWGLLMRPDRGHGHQDTKCLTHLLDVENENIDGFNSWVAASRRHSLAKCRGNAELRKIRHCKCIIMISGVTVQTSQ